MKKTRLMLLLLMAVVVIAVGGFIIYFNYGKPWEYFTYKDQFETTLEEKYDRDFVIKKTRYDMNHGSTYYAYAYEKNHKDIEFYIGQNPRTNKIEDSFHSATWRYQARQELNSVIEEIYPDRQNYSVETILEQDPSVTEDGTIFNYKDVTSVEAGISMRETKITDHNKDKELQRVFQLLESIREKGVTFHSFGISFENKTMQLETNEIESVQDYNDLDINLVNYRK
ncbi:hypothetical protein ACFQ3N_16150 [Virgibacillus byunsanensis]|uniref:DUF3139 domain-containing protein n=1 Tax=Virgibacillus byunsanensis TaxID=570945 RepID=A0ABW3LSB9_9BACI